MPAVTLMLSDELKSRIDKLAKASGKLPHAFMLNALVSQITREEKRRAFVQSALVARAEVVRYGEVHESAEVHKWLLARAAGKAAVRPVRRGLPRSGR